MNTLPATPKGKPDFKALNQWSAEQIHAWIVKRLHARDRQWVPHRAEGETWHEMIADAYAYAKTSDETRLRMRDSMNTLASLVARYPHEDFKSPAAIENFLDLVPQILDDRDKRENVLHYLQRAAKKLPWTEARHDLKAACLQCLIDLGLREDTRYWKRLWTQGHPEIAGLIFSGILKEDPKSAFHWLGHARPWNTEIMIPVLDLHWASLLHDFSKAQLEHWIEDELMRGLESADAQAVHQWFLKEKDFVVRIPFEVSPNLGQLIKTGGIAVVEDGKKSTVYCDTLEHLDDIEVMASAFAEGKASWMPEISKTPVESLPTILHHIIRDHTEWQKKLVFRRNQQDPTSPLINLQNRERQLFSFRIAGQSP